MVGIHISIQFRHMQYKSAVEYHHAHMYAYNTRIKNNVTSCRDSRSAKSIETR